MFLFVRVDRNIQILGGEKGTHIWRALGSVVGKEASQHLLGLAFRESSHLWQLLSRAQDIQLIWNFLHSLLAFNHEISHKNPHFWFLLKNLIAFHHSSYHWVGRNSGCSFETGLASLSILFPPRYFLQKWRLSVNCHLSIHVSAQLFVLW